MREATAPCDILLKVYAYKSTYLLTYLLILQHSRLATDSFPLDIVTYRKAKQQ